MGFSDGINMLLNFYFYCHFIFFYGPLKTSRRTYFLIPASYDMGN